MNDFKNVQTVKTVCLKDCQLYFNKLHAIVL